MDIAMIMNAIPSSLTCPLSLTPPPLVVQCLCGGSGPVAAGALGEQAGQQVPGRDRSGGGDHVARAEEAARGVREHAGVHDQPVHQAGAGHEGEGGAGPLSIFWRGKLIEWRPLS